MYKVKSFLYKFYHMFTGTAFYCGCLFLCITFHLLESTEYIAGSPAGEALNKLLLLLTLILSARFLFTPKRFLYNIFWVLCFCLLFISYRVGDNRTLLDMFVLVTSGYGADFDKVAVTAKWTWIGIGALIIARPLLEIISTFRKIDWFSGSSFFSLGFLHNNSAGLFFFSVGLCLFITSCKRIKWKDVGELLIVLFLCWFLTKSRASSVCLGLLLMASVITKLSAGRWLQKSLRNRGVVFCLSAFSIVSAVFSLLTAIFYHSSSAVMNTVNQYVNGRFEISSRYYYEYGITVWGQIIPDGFQDFQQYLDCGYLYTLLNSGLITAIIVLSVFTWSLYQALSEKNVAVAAGIMIISILWIMERQPITSHMSWILSYGFTAIAFDGKDHTDRIPEKRIKAEKKNI